MGSNIFAITSVVFVALTCAVCTTVVTENKCQCDKFGQVINCTSLELTQFRSHEVGCAQAFNVLVLSKNRIEEFPNDVGKYRIVNLSSNALLQLEASDVQKTEVLDLSKNQINKINLGETFPALISLNVSGNGLGIPYKEFLSGRCNLVHLDLGGNTIESLESITTCTNLSVLVAARNMIAQLPSDLTVLRKLEYLDLSNNRLKSVSNFPQTLKILHLNGNAISTVRATSFANLALLKSLDLDANRINNIVPNSFQDLSSLEVIDFANNNIANLSVESFKGLKALKRLELSNNDIESLAANTFSELHELRELVLDENMLTTLPPLLLGTKVYRVSLLLNLIQKMDYQALMSLFSGNESPRIVVLVLNAFRGDDPAWKKIVQEFKWRCADELIPLVEKFLQPDVLKARYHSLQLPTTECPCAFFSNQLRNFGLCINDVPLVNGQHWIRVFEDFALPSHDEL